MIPADLKDGQFRWVRYVVEGFTPTAWSPAQVYPEHDIVWPIAGEKPLYLRDIAEWGPIIEPPKDEQ